MNRWNRHRMRARFNPWGDDDEWNDDEPQVVRPRQGAWRLPVPRQPKYDEATKTRAIQQFREGVSYSQIARSVGPNCSTATIFMWVAKARAEGHLPPAPPRRQTAQDGQNATV